MKKVLVLTKDPLVNLRQTINGGGMSDDGKCRFYINDIDTTPDFIAVVGKIGIGKNVYGIPKSNTILLTYEPYGIIEYPRGYCEQFGTVLSCQPELKVSENSGTKVIYAPAMTPWFVGTVFGKDGKRTTMSREEIQTAPLDKKRFMSVITSRKAFTKGHLDRLRFIKKLKEHYGNRIDVFGGGNIEFDDKWETVAPYKYHIVIENSESDYYWTEKLSDSFLAGAYPLYYGCRNIKDYFMEGSYTPININDFDSVVNIIDNLEHNKVYENSVNKIAVAKQMVLKEYNMFNYLASVVDSIKCSDRDVKDFVKPASSFFSLHNTYLHTIKWSYYKLIGKNLL